MIRTINVPIFPPEFRPQLTLDEMPEPFGCPSFGQVTINLSECEAVHYHSTGELPRWAEDEISKAQTESTR